MCPPAISSTYSRSWRQRASLETHLLLRMGGECRRGRISKGRGHSKGLQCSSHETEVVLALRNELVQEWLRAFSQL